MPKAVMQPFRGFDKNAMQFWHELAAEMSKEWFVANKQRYEAQWVAPMTALLGEVTEKLRPAYKPLALGEPKVMRIYRDTRFSKDKAPYKTHIGGYIAIAGGGSGPAVASPLYLHIGAGERFACAGHYMMDGEQLARFRVLDFDARFDEELIGFLNDSLDQVIAEKCKFRLHKTPLK